MAQRGRERGMPAEENDETPPNPCHREGMKAWRSIRERAVEPHSQNRRCPVLARIDGDLRYTSHISVPVPANRVTS
jgi:hypothetical protein